MSRFTRRGGGVHEIDGIIHELTCKFSCILKLAQYIHIIQAYQVYHGILGSWEKLLSEILQTILARRATLRDTSWARLTTDGQLELYGFSTLLRIQDRA